MSAINHSASTQFIDTKHETIFGPHMHSLIKSEILNILRANEYVVKYDDFVYKVVRSRWDETSEETKFGVNNPEENTQVHMDMQRERILKECTVETGGEMLPRLVVIQYSQDYSKVPVSGNMYPPVGNFQQKGMVIDLESREILNPGMSWINTLDDLQALDDIYMDTHYSSTVQTPIEGATVSIFLDPKDSQIYFGTGHRVLSLQKVFLHNRGSRWNFFGKDLPICSGGIFSIGQTARGFNIHGAALECIVNACLEFKGIDRLPENDTEALVQIEKLIREVIFRYSDNLVVVGIVSGKAFAGQSQTMSEKDLEFTSFTPTSYLLRHFNVDAKKTIWSQDLQSSEHVWDELDAILNPFSINTQKFMINDLPSAYYNSSSSDPSVWLTDSNSGSIGVLERKEDVLLIQEIRENGTRGVYRYSANQTEFREDVLRGFGEELEEIKVFFPKHRARINPTPANIRERVHQVITLSIAGKSRYSFQKIDLLGSKGAERLVEKISEETAKLCGKDLFDHWKDIAFPISDFSIQTSELGSRTIPRMLVSPINRSLCNSLTVLYACASESLREQIVYAIADFFHNRALVAATAFLPSHAYRKVESRYLQKVPQADTDTRLPIGIHKLQMLRSLAASAVSNSSRKYKIASLISKNTVLDITFMSSVIVV